MLTPILAWDHSPSSKEKVSACYYICLLTGTPKRQEKVVLVLQLGKESVLGFLISVERMLSQT